VQRITDGAMTKDEKAAEFSKKFEN